MHFYKTHITGVLSHALKQSLQFIDCHEWPHDSNLTLNILLRSLVEFSEVFLLFLGA